MFNWFDLIMILIIVLVAVSGYIRGAIKSILSLVGGIVSIIVAYTFSKAVSPYIYDMFFKQSVSDKVSNSVSNSLDSSSGNLGDAVYNALPDFLRKIVGENTLSNAVGAVADGSQQQITDAAVDAVQEIVAPIITALIGFIVVIIVFALLKVVIAVAIRAADVVNKLPVIGTANKIVGAVIGCIYGAVLVLTVSLIIGVMPSSENKGFNDVRQGSFFVNIFMDKDNNGELYDAQYATEYSTDHYIEGE